ncbi:uncharacterized protein CIMG_12784 [Coccidioides immitis RS]|uniref:Uncharacterized protein n=1 Tax=Coccidioides immitis (strain RS) TaxID=246410 RepID=A0A0D8JS56_COCIM|nr:uncharacterized protein CIMG_12784 [Coccidioides immitis RS]KJF60160.1 hypothetical protein CIMG_12784 [Coccidioides immitis RS]
MEGWALCCFGSFVFRRIVCFLVLLSRKVGECVHASHGVPFCLVTPGKFPLGTMSLSSLTLLHSLASVLFWFQREKGPNCCSGGCSDPTSDDCWDEGGMVLISDPKKENPTIWFFLIVSANEPFSSFVCVELIRPVSAGLAFSSSQGNLPRWMCRTV